MKLRALREQVCRANLELPRRGLALYTWGNVSGIDRRRGLVVIKPSGVDYEGMSPEHMVTVDLATGEVVEGTLRPSSDTPSHLVLYRAFSQVGGIVHTHSTWATAWAQAGMSIPCLGTTHADSFYGPIPCTRPLTPEQIGGAYEAETGRIIVRTLEGTDPLGMPAALVAGHGPFAWGRDAGEAVYHAVVLEEAARMAWAARLLNPGCGAIDPALLDRHFLRKHGPDATYGQSGGDS